VAAVAAVQHGVVSRHQSHREGLSDDALRRRAAVGRLIVPYSGVYVEPGSPKTFERSVLAAVLAVGEVSAASHATAGHLMGIVERPPRRLDVVALGKGHRDLPGVRVHGARRLDSVHLAQIHNIPTTSAAFTLLCLCAVLDDRRALRCFDEAIRLGLTTPEELEALHAADFANGHPGAPRWRRLLTDLVPRLRSVHEARVFRALVRGGLPRPEWNVPVDVDGTTYWLDLAYPEAMLAVEADSSHHEGAAAIDHDGLRERRLMRIGWWIEHFSRDEALRDPIGLAARVAARRASRLAGRERRAA
jgi:hypothetical protein